MKKPKRRQNLLVLVEEDAGGLLPPQRKGDVGFDLRVSKETVIPPGADLPPTDVPSGIRVKLPEGTWGLIMSRSGTHLKFPTLRVCQAPIDNGYVGPLCPRFRNIGVVPVVVPRGARLAQLVILPAVVPQVTVVDELPPTERGGKRYGSTG